MLPLLPERAKRSIKVRYLDIYAASARLGPEPAGTLRAVGQAAIWPAGCCRGERGAAEWAVKVRYLDICPARALPGPELPGTGRGSSGSCGVLDHCNPMRNGV